MAQSVIMLRQISSENISMSKELSINPAAAPCMPHCLLWGAPPPFDTSRLLELIDLAAIDYIFSAWMPRSLAEALTPSVRSRSFG